MKDQRKIDWMRIITAYSIPMLLLIGALFVGSYRLTQGEQNLKKKVDKATHIVEHENVDLRINHTEQAVVKIAERVEILNYQSQQIHQATLREILKEIKNNE